MAKAITRESYLIPSKSEKGEYHKVEIFFNSHWACDCVRFSFSGKCSHILEAEKIKNHDGREL
ncbi:MAG: hypothetical protein WCQ96_02930 [Patescibacteria group bacterium]